MDSPPVGIAADAAPSARRTRLATIVPISATWRERLKVAAYRAAARAVPRLPAVLTVAAARGAGLVLWAVCVGMRRQAQASLRHVPALATDSRRRRQAVRRAFGHLALNYRDLFTVASQSSARIQASFTVAGTEHLEAALRQGRGVVVVAAHLGDFDRAIAIVASRGVPVWLPVERLQPPAVFALCQALRSHHGVRAVPADSPQALREMLAALRRGEIVLLTADRDVLGTGVAVPLFGAPAPLPVGPLLLARRTGAPLIGAFSWRLSGGRSAGNFVPIDLAPVSTAAAHEARNGSQKDARDTARDRRIAAADLLPIARVLEDEIAAHPEQWVAAFTPIWDDDDERGASASGKDQA